MLMCEKSGGVDPLNFTELIHIDINNQMKIDQAIAKALDHPCRFFHSSKWIPVNDTNTGNLVEIRLYKNRILIYLVSLLPLKKICTQISLSLKIQG